jgi:hypothetical protein
MFPRQSAKSNRKEPQQLRVVLADAGAADGLDLTRFCGHFTVTQRGIQDVEIKAEIYARV